MYGIIYLIRDKGFVFNNNNKEVSMDLKKIEHGQFYTINNPFDHKMFKQWLSLIPNIENQVFLEPFAGINNITRLIEELGIDNKWKCYDINPDVNTENTNPKYPIVINNSFNNFPDNHNVIITNPPYLAKNSAKRRGYLSLIQNGMTYTSTLLM